jgi:hypothetical protein
MKVTLTARHADQAVDGKLCVALHCCVLRPAAFADECQDVLTCTWLGSVSSGVMYGELSHFVAPKAAAEGFNSA